MRLLHTMLRVGNLQRSIDFYTGVLGMTLLRRSENPEYKYSLAFVGYEGNPAQAEIELTYNHGTESYDMGTAYDFFGEEDHFDYTKHSAAVLKNRKLFRAAMEKRGFSGIRTEWWHFSYAKRKYNLSDFQWKCE